jgi:hypothetical protein
VWDTNWNDAAFHADRYGQHDADSNIPTFNIEYAPGVDHYPHSGAPSRPPSRTSHHAGASSTHGGDAPIPSIENGGQEMGVIGSEPVFGPATKAHYESSQWALVPVSKATEYIPDAKPHDRKRDMAGPAVLKPLASEDYLPALLTILHSIPRFRDALLSPDISSDDYSVDEGWWRGEDTPRARTVEVGAVTGRDYDLDITFETQRLMAFLDLTERAYGSVASLLGLDAWNNPEVPASEDSSELLHFLLRWKSAFTNLHPGSSLQGDLLTVFNANGTPEESFVLDAPVVHTESDTSVTLYDVLDATLFSSAAQHAYIERISAVLILRLESAKPGATTLDCKIPSTFYADRYLEVNKQSMDSMFAKMQTSKDRIQEIDKAIESNKYVKTKEGKKWESLAVLTTSMRAFEPDADGNQTQQDQNTLSELEKLHDSIQNKLKSNTLSLHQALPSTDTLSTRRAASAYSQGDRVGF